MSEVMVLSLVLATDNEQQFNYTKYRISISDIKGIKSKNNMIKLQDIITNTNDQK
jgi:hypothetical protein